MNMRIIHYSVDNYDRNLSGTAYTCICIYIAYTCIYINNNAYYIDIIPNVDP